MKIINTKREFQKVFKEYYLKEGNEKSAIKIKLPQRLIYLTKGLWADYIEDIMWRYDREVIQVLQRQCILREDEFKTIISHPAGSLGCIFLLSPETLPCPFLIQPIELPAEDLDDWLKEETRLPEIEEGTRVIGISRYDFLQDIKEWIKGENKVTSWEG